MFPFIEQAQAFLTVSPSGGLVLKPARELRARFLPGLIRLERDGGAARLVTLSGSAIAAGPRGLRPLPAGRMRPAARCRVTPTQDGAALLSFRGAFLAAGAAGPVVTTTPDAAAALRFRLLGPRAAFRAVEGTIVRLRGQPRPNGRFLRFARNAWIGDGAEELRDARVLAHDWVAFTPGGTCHLAPHGYSRQRLSRDVAAYPLPSPGRLDAAALLGGHDNYYHHLVDFMVDWFDLRGRVPDGIPLLSVAPTQRFQAEILDAFGIADRIRPLDGLSLTRVRRLIVPRSAVVRMGEVRDPATIEACRAFLDARIAPRLDAPRRLFVSRAAAGRRRAANEAQAIAIAQRSGFRAVMLEELGFLDQVALFRRAEAVAGLHGAGFANLIFAPPGCRVIEIMPTDPQRPPHFANLSAGLGLAFRRVDAAGGFQSNDLAIDLAGLEAALAALPG
ncbi:glycosyltransferase family 61 protein [Falsiroseomonas sp. HW251]|uniref:glycosyltransferase family 61 protein n=1 Tax=Falsiroseomonas sp. HW251 TaxID=3390998 RepID=UPI003D322407